MKKLIKQFFGKEDTPPQETPFGRQYCEQKCLDITEQNLIDLGFEKNMDLSGDFYYYFLPFAMGFGLISCASDEVDGGWYVDVFDTSPIIRFRDYAELSNFIDIVKRNKRKDNSD